MLEKSTASGERIACPDERPMSLSTLLHARGIVLSMPCGGCRRCGKCKIYAVGDLSPVTEAERQLLSEEELAAGIRLACFATVTGEVTVRPLSTQFHVLSAVHLPPCRCGGTGYGLAVDVGTTTIAMQLYALSTGHLVGEALSANRQSSFGADVISRIEFSNKNGVTLLQETLHQQLREMGEACLRQAGISAIEKTVLTGNTTMLHLWEGLDPRSLAVAPFTPQSLFGGLSAQSLLDAPVYLPPCVGAYVGADLLCAVLSSGMAEGENALALLVDLGTNGEIALLHQGALRCASTAMGPAFEGANLSCGMAAAAGAVCGVESLPDGSVTVRTVGNGEAVGLCGSGVLDAVATLLDREWLDETGLLSENAPGVSVQNGQSQWQLPGTQVTLTQPDIRQVQLAKAAVYAGIQTLLAAEGLTAEDVPAFYVAGGFGHHMNGRSAARIGLFPAPWQEHTQVLGNAALSGAAYLLLDGDAQNQMTRLQAAAQEYPLSGNRIFSEQYIESMLFEQEDE